MRMPLSIESAYCPALSIDEVRKHVTEAEGCMLQTRDALRSLLGEADADALYRVGDRDARRFLRAIQSSEHRRAQSGFIDHLQALSDTGIADFKVVDLDIREDWAVVEAGATFESRPYASLNIECASPQCDYVRGILASAYREAGAERSGSEYDCVETNCAARGDSRCRFIVGPPARIAELGHGGRPQSYKATEVFRIQKETLRAINEITARAADDQAGLCAFALDSALRILRLDAGSLFILDGFSAFKLMAQRSPKSPRASAFYLIRERAMTEAAVKLAPVMCELPPGSASDNTRSVDRFSLRSLTAFPIKSRDVCLGVLCVCTRGERFLSSLEMEFLEAVASQTAIALENGRLLNTVVAQTQHLERAVETTSGRLEAQNEELQILIQIATTVGGTLNLKQMLKSAGTKILELTGFSSFAIYLVDRTRGGAMLASSFGAGSRTLHKLGGWVAFGEGFAGRVSLSGEPIVASDFNEISDMAVHPSLLELGVKSFASIPLRARDQVVGVINLSSLRRRDITERERDLLCSIGNILGVAIENARLYERARTQARQERIENSIGFRVRRSLNADQVCEAAVIELGRLLHVSRCFLAEIRDGLAVVSYEFTRPSVRSARGTYPLALFDRATIEKIESGNTIAVSDVENDPLMKPIYETLFRPFGAMSILLVPIISEGDWFAVLGVDHCTRKHVWTEEEINLAQLVADHTALAVQKARLYERTRKSEQAYIAVYDESPDMHHTLDTNGRIIMCNSTEIRTLGFSGDELRSMTWADLCVEPVGETLMKRVRSAGAGVVTMETAVKARSGELLQVSLRAAPVIEGGACTGARIVMRDITAQRKLERQLLQAQKMESLGTMAGGIAHDFNNLLTAMIGYATLIKRKSRPGEAIYKYADTIERSGNRASDLTRQMLAFASTGTLQAEVVDLNMVIKETITLLSRSIHKKIEIGTQLEPNLDLVEADPVQIEQVLINLCLNARDAMAGGGRLTIASANVKRRASSRGRSYSANTSGVLLTVSDTGHGMDEDVRSRIFDPFFTTKDPGKGTGLGLAMAYGIVTQHGGTIEVESEVGAGTVFRIFLPAYAGPAAVVDSRRREIPASASASVLIVDDEPDVRGLLQDLFSSHGMSVSTAKSGREAVEIYREHGSEIDVVLMDMIMPEMDGRETFWILKAINPAARIVLFSGYSADDGVKSLLEAGAKAFIRKPCPSSELLATISRALQN